MIKKIREMTERERQRAREREQANTDRKARDYDLFAAYIEGRRAERKAIAQWLRSKAYFTLSDLIRGRAHLEGDSNERPTSNQRGEEGSQT